MPGTKSTTVRRIGAHTSIAGGLVNAANEALELGCNTLQIFTRSPRMWRSAPLDPNGVAQLNDARAEHDLSPLVIHGNYLTNMAAADPVVRSKSITAFRDEVRRALMIAADYLVIHPGSYRGQTLDKAMNVLAASIARSVKGLSWNGLQLLLENTAGGGQSMGRDFTELAELRERIEKKAAVPVAFCIDTAHCFEAGYDVSTAVGLKRTTALIEGSIGLDSVKVIHANDSKTPLGSRADRHEHIGEGRIGTDAFRRILNHPQWRTKPFILETPADKDGTHRKNVEALQSLSKRRRPRARLRSRR